MSTDKQSTDIDNRLRPSEEQTHSLAADAASVMAEVFLTQGWTLRGNIGPDGKPAIPTGEQIAAVVSFCLEKSLTPKKSFLPDYARDRIKVQVYPDLSVAEVWLRVGDLQWSKTGEERIESNGLPKC